MEKPKRMILELPGGEKVTNVIVAFSKAEDARSMKHILTRSGFQVTAVCTSGAQTLNQADGLSRGIVVSGYRFTDMLYSEVMEYLPPGFQMLLIASASRFEGGALDGLVYLPMPFKVYDLVNTMEMMVRTQERIHKKMKSQPRSRSGEERTLIAQAKQLLMERNNMTEDEAHRYIQKCSMDSGTNMAETARMVMSLLD